MLATFNGNDQTLRFVVPVGVNGNLDVTVQCGGEEIQTIHKGLEVKALAPAPGISPTPPPPVATGCGRDHECAVGQTCNTTTHMCEVPAGAPVECTVNSDCSGGKICDASKHCVASSTGGGGGGGGSTGCTPACTSSQTCNATTHVCETPPAAGCGSNPACGVGEQCVNGSCVAPVVQPPECSPTVACSNGRVCASGHCEACSADPAHQCVSGLVCQNGSCGTPPVNACRVNSDCNNGTCNTGVSPTVCVPNTNSQCPATCPSGQVCSASTNYQCVPIQTTPQCTSASCLVTGQLCNQNTHQCENQPTFVVEGPTTSGTGYSGIDGLVYTHWDLPSSVTEAYVYGPFNRKPGDADCEYVNSENRYLIVTDRGVNIVAPYQPPLSGSPNYSAYLTGLACEDNPETNIRVPINKHQSRMGALLGGQREAQDSEDSMHSIPNPNYCYGRSADFLSPDSFSSENLLGGSDRGSSGLVDLGLIGSTVPTAPSAPTALSCRVNLVHSGHALTPQKSFYTKMYEDEARFVLVYSQDGTHWDKKETTLGRRIPRADFTPGSRIITVTALDTTATGSSIVTTPKIHVEFSYQSAINVEVTDGSAGSNTCMTGTNPINYPSGTYVGDCALNAAEKFITISVTGEGHSNVKTKIYRVVLGAPTLTFQPTSLSVDRYPTTICDPNVTGQNNQAVTSPNCPGTVNFDWTIRRSFVVQDTGDASNIYVMPVPWIRTVQFWNALTGDTSGGGWGVEKSVDSRGGGTELLRRDFTHTEWQMRVTDFDGWERIYSGLQPKIYKDENAYAPFFRMVSDWVTERVDDAGQPNPNGLCSARDHIRDSVSVEGQGLKSFRFWCESPPQGNAPIADDVSISHSSGSLILNMDNPLASPEGLPPFYGHRSATVSIVANVNSANDWRWEYWYDCIFEAKDYKDHIIYHREYKSADQDGFGWDCTVPYLDNYDEILFPRAQSW